MKFLLRERMPNWQPEPFTQIHVQSRKRTLGHTELRGVILNDDTTVAGGALCDSDCISRQKMFAIAFLNALFN